MPCAVAEPPALGAKIVSVFRDNPARGLPTVTSIYVLSDYATGEPLALMDGGYLTGIRTAAGSAVATQALARPEARTLGVFGTGVQARFHVETIRRVRSLDRVLVAATSPDKAAAVRRRGSPKRRGCRRRRPRLKKCRLPTSSPRVLRVPPPWWTPAPSVRAPTSTRSGAFTPHHTRAALCARGARGCVRRHAAGRVQRGGRPAAGARRRRRSRWTTSGVKWASCCWAASTGGPTSNEVTIYKSVGAAFLDAATARLAYEAATRNAVGTVYEFQAE